MQYFQSINLLQTPGNQVYPGSLSSSNNNNMINGPGFDYFLNQQFKNNTINRIENNQYNYELPEEDNHFLQNDRSLNKSRDEISKDRYSNVNRNGKNNNINKTSEKTSNQSVKNEEEAGKSKPDINNKITAEQPGSEEKIEKKKINTYGDLSGLLKDILSLLNQIKENSLNKKQLNELKSVLSGMEQLFLKKNDLSHDKELQALLKKFKQLIESFNKKLNALIKDRKHRFEFEGHKAANDLKDIKDLKELNHFKNLLTKLKNEISGHLGKMSERTERIAGRNNETGNPNNNSINQKLHTLNSATETKDFNDVKEYSGNKENSSNNNFQFMKREAEIEPLLSRNNVKTAASKNSFSEQLNKLVQNAKIYIKDSKNGSFSIRLYPESLGRVNVNLNLEHGVIIGKFLVENSDAKEALIDNMAIIRERLQENGIAVGEFQVNVRDQNSSTSDFKKEPFLYTDAGEHNASINSQYEVNSFYSHDGEINLVI